MHSGSKVRPHTSWHFMNETITHSQKQASLTNNNRPHNSQLQRIGFLQVYYHIHTITQTTIELMTSKETEKPRQHEGHHIDNDTPKMSWEQTDRQDNNKKDTSQRTKSRGALKSEFILIKQPLHLNYLPELMRKLQWNKCKERYKQRGLINIGLSWNRKHNPIT